VIVFRQPLIFLNQLLLHNKLIFMSSQKSRRQFIKLGLAGAVGFGVASAIEVSVFGGAAMNDQTEIKQKNAQISQLQPDAQKAADLQNQIIDYRALTTVDIDAAVELEAMLEALIPANLNGPNPKELGVVSFIDCQLSGVYGSSGNRFMQTTVTPQSTGSFNVDGVIYPQGSVVGPLGSSYHYNMTLREFWRAGLLSLQDYSINTYGRKFESLTGDQQLQILSGLKNNVPTSFNGITPNDFYTELTLMTAQALKIIE
jgi:hypothetical protein